jgi:8-oxo-dGTP pyrophosphatase MutT (NUDIX family)
VTRFLIAIAIGIVATAATAGAQTPIGWVEPALVALWMTQCGLPCAFDAQAMRPMLVVAADPLLFTTVARAALAQGMLTGWRDELFDVIIPGTGQPIFALERSAFRLFGLQSQAAQLIGYRPDGAVWVARRSQSKAIDPGLLDTLVGGGVRAGESPTQTLLREASEEAGLTPEQTARAVACREFELWRRVAPGVQNERVTVFTLAVEPDWTPVNTDGEVDSFLCLDSIALEQRLAGGEFAYEAALSIWAAQAAQAAQAVQAAKTERATRAPLSKHGEF